MRIIELILDENNIMNGVDAISIVNSPATESNFIALKEQQHEVKFKAVDEEKRILMGAALVPNKMIFRRDEKTKDEFYVYFNASTIRKASELYLQRGNQNNATIEHKENLTGVSVVESWIVEGEQDKSRIYGLAPEVGTWMISMKVNNEAVWQEAVKTGKVLGFSIEGYFAEKAQLAKQPTEAEQTLAALRELLKIEQQ